MSWSHGLYCICTFIFFDISTNKSWFASFKVEEIILPELEEMRTAHVVSIGSESFCDLNPHYKAGYLSVWWLSFPIMLSPGELWHSFTRGNTSSNYWSTTCWKFKLFVRMGYLKQNLFSFCLSFPEGKLNLRWILEQVWHFLGRSLQLIMWLLKV